jgi:hypothetical protein
MKIKVVALLSITAFFTAFGLSVKMNQAQRMTPRTVPHARSVSVPSIGLAEAHAQQVWQWDCLMRIQCSNGAWRDSHWFVRASTAQQANYIGHHQGMAYCRQACNGFCQRWQLHSCGGAR